MKTVERELEQLREALNALAQLLREAPPYIWDAPTCRGVARVVEQLSERSAMLDAGAPAEFTEPTVRELIRQTVVEMDDRGVGEALKQLTFEAALGGHDLTEWREQEDGDLRLSCRRCGQAVHVNAVEIQNDLEPECPAVHDE